jgi:hypothetical protein
MSTRQLPDWLDGYLSYTLNLDLISEHEEIVMYAKAWDKYMNGTGFNKDSCVFWKGPRLNRYGYIQIESRKITAHRLSYLIHYGYLPENMDISHLCDKPLCVNPYHLKAVSHQENIRGSVLRGRATRYASVDLVNKIKEVYATGEYSERDLAKMFNRHRSSIHRILSGRCYV